ncbi:hypothetical protein E6C27_scaffold27257G00010 [Cucumis melo var. makuwa]|uniref:Uncharacterized protein n=1 Tax=Cucumis melo var. makuwa TaxID=1194695 RepID=A0A5A7SPD5_CUCMM|nr:hypothetical protein E6C27_scaffold27257G00010 [Cucumis melo var. makuwa]
MCASFGSTRLMCASFGSTRLICASFGITRLNVRSTEPLDCYVGHPRIGSKGTVRGRPTSDRKDA